MIYTERGPAPPLFSSQLYARLRAETEHHFRQYSPEKRQMRFNFKITHLQPQVKSVLLERFAAKCAYCESTLVSPRQANIDFYRPRTGARGNKERGAGGRQGFYENHYWWLAWEWDNMLPACAECDTRKSNWFPLVNEAARVMGPGDDLSQEQPLLLNPCADDPNQHLRFEGDGRVYPLTERGAATIELLSLNRSSLIEQRLRHLKEVDYWLATVRAMPTTRLNQEANSFLHVVEAALERLKMIYERRQDVPYLAAQRQYLLKQVSGEPTLLQQLGAELTEQHQSKTDKVRITKVALRSQIDFPAKLSRLSIERIELRNFKNIARLTLHIPAVSEDGQTPWLLFLGENAVGKSAIMQAIALTLMGDEMRAQLPNLTPETVLRYYRVRGRLQPAPQGWVKIWTSGQTEPLKLSFRKGSPKFESNLPKARGFLIAYGSTRLLPDSDNTAYEVIEGEHVRVRHLFRTSTPLIDAEKWLYNLYEKDQTGFDLMIRGLRDLLLLGAEDRIMPDSTHPEKRRILIEFKNRREVSTVSQLSDGYRTVLALACDMMSVLMQQGTSLETAEGLVIIDELESNLHPSWKKRIVGSFRKVFPKLQFIVSTHDPLCLRGIFEHETVLLRRDGSQQVVAVTNLPNPADLRVDELLASEFFGLNTTLDTDLEEIYDEYYELLIKQRLIPTEQQRLQELKKQLQQREHLGHGLRDELMYEVIDKLIAREQIKARPKSRPELKKETLRKVLQAWKEANLLVS